MSTCNRNGVIYKRHSLRGDGVCRHCGASKGNIFVTPQEDTQVSLALTSDAKSQEDINLQVDKLLSTPICDFGLGKDIPEWLDIYNKDGTLKVVMSLQAVIPRREGMYHGLDLISN